MGMNIDKAGADHLAMGVDLPARRTGRLAQGHDLAILDAKVARKGRCAGAVIVGLATLATAALVFMLSLRLRRRERETMSKIGGSRAAVASIMFSEIGVVLATALVLSAGLTWITSQYGGLAIRFILRS